MPSAPTSPTEATRWLSGSVLGVALGGLLLWFGLLYPLLPRTVTGWVVATVAGLAAASWAAVCVYILRRIEGRPGGGLIWKAVGVLVALSLGLGLFGLAVVAREFIAKNFSYLGQ
jgi:hypothetical protein